MLQLSSFCQTTLSSLFFLPLPSICRDIAFSLIAPILRHAYSLFTRKRLQQRDLSNANRFVQPKFIGPKSAQAAIRADLEDYEFSFIQGTVRHTEGNWSLYTSAFSKLPLYAYYNPVLPTSILQTEKELLSIIREEGPFDGVLGYSGGAALAAQLIIKDQEENPMSLPHERPFRFAVFINGASPLHVFPVKDLDDSKLIGDDSIAKALGEEAADMLLRPSAVRKKAGIDEEDQPDYQATADALAALRGVVLPDGYPVLTDGEHALARYNTVGEKTLIDIPTLHIRCPTDTRHNGLHLYEMCEPTTREEFHHTHGHDFPRGREQMKKIAELVRQVAESA